MNSKYRYRVKNKDDAVYKTHQNIRVKNNNIIKKRRIILRVIKIKVPRGVIDSIYSN